MLAPAAPPEVLEAAEGLRYRDFLTVALVVDGEDLFPDNWIYIHEPGVRVGRIQNFRSWSPWMVPDPSKACVGMEYFCFEGDDLWSMSDDGLVALAAEELEKLRLASSSKVERGYAIRVPKAYPIYDADYAERVQVIRGHLETIDNLQQVGRNGLHRYNNSDHSMLTAMRAVDNLLARHRSRHLGRERRERLPRDARRGRAPVPLRARDARDAGPRGDADRLSATASAKRFSFRSRRSPPPVLVVGPGVAHRSSRGR